ncbi:MAG: peptidylprolyl isomerase [Chromatiaceae bacterium]|nr:peptidylprolyl isomerase [Chromatiaceae bacterium]MCP5315399.1 peptidylprolyl isomerase [Chromatiaceae bacterium]
MSSINMNLISIVVLLVSLYSTGVVFADAKGNHVELGGYKQESLVGDDLSQEIEAIRAEKNIRVEPDRQVMFTLVDNLLTRRALALEAQDQQLIPEAEMKIRLQRQREIWLAQARMDSLARQLTDEELENAAKEIYIAHSEDYLADETVDVSHILLRTDGQCRDEAATRKLAGELHKQLMEDPGQFEALAKAHSDDVKTARKGGALGVMATKRLVEPFKDAALALSPGGISEPVETQFGLHIIRLNAYSPSAKLPFDKVKGALMAQAKKQARSTTINAHITEIKKSADYRYDEGAVQRYFENYFADSEKKKAAPGAGENR